MISNKEKNGDSFFLISDLNENEITINPKNYLFNNFLIKENKNYFSNKRYTPQKEIMPEYSDINIQIQKKINNVRDFYGYDPIFREMLSKNSYAMTIFKKGFTDMFFGPKGIVTRKSSDLKKYYKSLEPKVDLSSKIYAGSLDYYDFLSNYNSFFERLKISRKRMLKISGNFTVSNTSSDKLRAKYNKYEQNRKKKGSLSKKNNSNYFNKKSLAQINEYNNNIYNKTDIKSKTNNDFSKRFSTKSKNLFLENNNFEDNKNKTYNNTFLNYKKNSQNYVSHKMNEHTIKNKIMNISLPTEENLIGKQIRKNRKEKTEIYPIIRKEKKNLSNISTISVKIKNNDLTNITNSNIYSNLINKSPIKKKNTFIFQTPKKLSNDKLIKNTNNIELNLNDSISKNNSKIIDKSSKNRITLDNYISNKSLRYNEILQKENNKKYLKSLEAIKCSLKNRIDSSMPKNRKFENSLNKFIENNKKYELKKKDILKRRMKEELQELKEDMKGNGKYNDLPKNVDFSDVKGFSPKSNHKIINKIKGTSFNLAFSYKTRFEKNMPIKDFLNNLEVIKEKEKEKKFLKYIRKNFKKNIKVIHNLTISLDNIKKKYNY